MMATAVSKLVALVGEPPCADASKGTEHQAPGARWAVPETRGGDTPGPKTVPRDVAADAERIARNNQSDNHASKVATALKNLEARVARDQYDNFVLLPEPGRHPGLVLLEAQEGHDAIFQQLQEETRRAPPKNAVDTVIVQLRNAARTGGRKIHTHTRIAQADGRRILDLNDGQGRCAVVSGGRWHIESPAGVFFNRARGAGRLPEPVSTGDPRQAFSVLRAWLLGLGVPRDRAGLVIVTLVAWLRTGATFPVLLLYGVAGSGKSTAAKLILSLIDPTESLALPNVKPKPEDVAAAAQHRHILAFDNISKLTGDTQDLFCTCATGGEILARRLYSNGDVAILPIHRPLLVTAVQPVITRPDLMSRTILVEFAQRTTRQTDREIIDDYLALHPALLGALLDLLALEA